MNVGNSKKRKHKTFTDSIPRTRPLGIFHATLKGYLFSLGIGAILTLSLSFLVYSLSDPARYVTPVAFCILYISALLGGFLSAKFNHGSALLCGLLYSAMMLITMLAVSLFFNKSFSADHPLSLAIGLRGVAVLLAITGAMIGTHKRKQKRRRK